jgi:hemoglobin
MPSHPPFDVVTEETIARVVDAFYARIRSDPALGPIFARTIAAEGWPTHLRRMYAFWSSVMLTSGRYKGDPVAVHKRVAGIEPELFGSWLELFEATAAELFVPALAAEFATKARRIAESLRLALFFRPDQPWPIDLRQRPPLAAR